jgi:hypothetical protein
MKSPMLTLWDLVDKVIPKHRLPAASPTTQASRSRPTTGGSAAAGPRRGPLSPPSSSARSVAAPSMQSRYDAMTRDMLYAYGVRVRRWRTAMSGIAWELRYHDGRTARLIEAPRPKGPMSAAIFLHEIGHHAIGFHTYKPRCLEEYHAWVFVLDQMEKLGLNITDNVRRRMHDSLHYAVQKATRRGIKAVPAELEPYARARWKQGT